MPAEPSPYLGNSNPDKHSDILTVPYPTGLRGPRLFAWRRTVYDAME